MSNMHSNSFAEGSKVDPLVTTDAEMSVTEYREWVDALVQRAESLEKARQHTPSKIFRRSSLQTISAELNTEDS